jgi:hypothetical protein
MNKMVSQIMRCCFFTCAELGVEPPTGGSTKGEGLLTDIVGAVSDLYNMGESIATFGDRRKALKLQNKMGELSIRSAEGELEAQRQERMRTKKIRDMLLRGSY